MLATPWDPLQRAYFNGYALRTYLTTPSDDTIWAHRHRNRSSRTTANAGWVCRRASQTRSRVTANCRSSIFGSDFLLRRHDYRVDVAGGFAAIQYVYDTVEADGITLPSKRRAYRCDDGT